MFSLMIYVRCRFGSRIDKWNISNLGETHFSDCYRVTKPIRKAVYNLLLISNNVECNDRRKKVWNAKAFWCVAGDFRREDLARAWLNYAISDMVEGVHSACLLSDVNRAFFCGGFCGNPLVRRVITTEMARRNMFKSMLLQVPTPFTCI
jgi:hypothetical protein